MRSAAVVAVALSAAALFACKKEEGGAAKTCATCVVADQRGFTPNKITVPAGKAGETKELTFTRTSDETCARDIVFPELNVNVPLPLNTPVSVKVPAGEAKTYTFQCGMGMYKSSVIVASQ